jgi:hypothetical protein
LSQASNLAIDGPARAGARPARRPRGRAASDQAVLDHYLKRLDPEVAASFTEAQREALKTLFGARELAKHAVELRRSVPLPGGRRFYLVFLLGREKRGITRLYSQGAASKSFDVLWYLGLGALCLAPVLALLTAGGI